MRRFQNDDQSNDSTLLKSGKIPNDQYVKRLNEIFLNQRKALEPDNPIMTPSESDTATDHEDLLEKEVERDEDDRSHAGRSSILRPKVFESAVAPLGGRIMKEKSNQNERAKLEEELLSGLVIGSKGSSDNEENVRNGGFRVKEPIGLQLVCSSTIRISRNLFDVTVNKLYSIRFM